MSEFSTKQLAQLKSLLSEVIKPLETRFDSLETRFDSFESKVDKGFGDVKLSLNSLEMRLSQALADLGTLLGISRNLEEWQLQHSGKMANIEDGLNHISRLLSENIELAQQNQASIEDLLANKDRVNRKILAIEKELATLKRKLNLSD